MDYEVQASQYNALGDSQRSESLYGVTRRITHCDDDVVLRGEVQLLTHHDD